MPIHGLIDFETISVPFTCGRNDVLCLRWYSLVKSWSWLGLWRHFSRGQRLAWGHHTYWEGDLCMACPLPVVFYYLRRFVSLFVITCKNNKLQVCWLNSLYVCWYVSKSLLVLRHIPRSTVKYFFTVRTSSLVKKVGQETKTRGQQVS